MISFCLQRYKKTFNSANFKRKKTLKSCFFTKKCLLNSSFYVKNLSFYLYTAINGQVANNSNADVVSGIRCWRAKFFD